MRKNGYLVVLLSLIAVISLSVFTVARLALFSSTQQAVAVTNVLERWSLLREGTLTACVHTGFAPVLYRTPQGLAGSDIVILRGFAARYRLELEYKEVPFDGIWLRPGRDECDLAMAGIAYIENRESPGVAWSDAYFVVKRSFLIRASDAEQYRSVADLSGHRLGYVTGSTAQWDIEGRRLARHTLREYASAIEGVRDLHNGRLDAFAAGDVSARFIAHRFPELLVLDIAQQGRAELFSIPSRNKSHIVEDLNCYLKEVLTHEDSGHGARAMP